MSASRLARISAFVVDIPSAFKLRTQHLVGDMSRGRGLILLPPLGYDDARGVAIGLRRLTGAPREGLLLSHEGLLLAPILVVVEGALVVVQKIYQSNFEM